MAAPQPNPADPLPLALPAQENPIMQDLVAAAIAALVTPGPEFTDMDPDTNGHDWQEYHDIFAYMGFDPRHVRSLIMQYALDAHANAPQDITLMCIMVIVMGTNSDKNLSGIREESRPIVEALIERYHIHTGKISEAANRRDAVTLNRIAHCFPDVMVQCMHNMPNGFVATGNPGPVPNAICFPGFASLIPHVQGSPVVDRIVSDHLSFLTEFDSTINATGYRSGGRQDGKSTSPVNWPYLAWNSGLISHNRKLELLVASGLLSRAQATAIGPADTNTPNPFAAVVGQPAVSSADTEAATASPGAGAAAGAS
jgi:hypothetical protein